MGKPDRKRTSKIPHQKVSKQSVKENESKTSSGSFFIACSEKVKLVKDKFSRKKNTQNAKFKNTKDVESKKPFDKKKWRIQRYSKKYKLEQWENKRKHAILQDYRKQINDMPKYNVQKIYKEYGEENENKNNLHKDLTHTKQTENKVVQNSFPKIINSKINKKPIKKAKTEFQRIREEKAKEKEELSKKKSERTEAYKRYKQQKLEKYKKLSKKTKKGQPIMKYRMEMLLEQIQKSGS